MLSALKLAVPALLMMAATGCNLLSDPSLGATSPPPGSTHDSTENLRESMRFDEPLGLIGYGSPPVRIYLSRSGMNRSVVEAPEHTVRLSDAAILSYGNLATPAWEVFPNIDVTSRASNFVAFDADEAGGAFTFHALEGGHPGELAVRGRWLHGALPWAWVTAPKVDGYADGDRFPESAVPAPIAAGSNNCLKPVAVCTRKISAGSALEVDRWFLISSDLIRGLEDGSLRELNTVRAGVSSGVNPATSGLLSGLKLSVGEGAIRRLVFSTNGDAGPSEVFEIPDGLSPANPRPAATYQFGSETPLAGRCRWVEALSP